MMTPAWCYHTHIWHPQGIFLSPMAWEKLIQNLEGKILPCFYSQLCCFFPPLHSHCFITIATELLFSAMSLVLQQGNCHCEHLFLWLEDNSTYISKPSQIPPCIFSSKCLMGTYLTASDPCCAAEVGHLGHSHCHPTPTSFQTHTWTNLLAKFLHTTLSSHSPWHAAHWLKPWVKVSKTWTVKNN